MVSAKVLLRLAKRCEAAQRPDAVLDGLIAQAIGWSPPEKDGFCGPDYIRRREYEWIDSDGCAKGFAPPRFTASLDTAMELIPEHYLLDALTDNGMDGARGCRVSNPAGSSGQSAGAATRSLSVAAAALRARALD